MYISFDYTQRYHLIALNLYRNSSEFLNLYFCECNVERTSKNQYDTYNVCAVCNKHTIT